MAEKIKIYDLHGEDFHREGFASAEALAQSIPLKMAVYVDNKHFWMNDTQQLETDPPVERRPPGARVYVASRTKDKELLRVLVKDEDMYVRWAINENMYVPDDVRKTLSKEGIIGSLHDIASNEKTPEKMLVMLASDSWREVRVVVAMNKKTPPATLALLAKDPHVTVRKAVAGNENTPPATLASLGKESDMAVQGEVAKNVKTPVSTLLDMAESPDEFVRIFAKKNSNYDPTRKP